MGLRGPSGAPSLGGGRHQHAEPETVLAARTQRSHARQRKQLRAAHRPPDRWEATKRIVQSILRFYLKGARAPVHVPARTGAGAALKTQSHALDTARTAVSAWAGMWSLDLSRWHSCRTNPLWRQWLTARRGRLVSSWLLHAHAHTTHHSPLAGDRDQRERRVTRASQCHWGLGPRPRARRSGSASQCAVAVRRLYLKRMNELTRDTARQIQYTSSVHSR